VGLEIAQEQMKTVPSVMHSSQAAKHPAAKIQAQAKASISRPYLKTGTKLKSASYHDIKFMALTNFN